MSSEQGARLLDLGYRRYDGPRRASAWAILTLAEFTVRRVLGLGRGARHKVLPALTLAIAYLPALASVTGSAQWDTKTREIPRTPDGKPNLSAPAPRAAHRFPRPAVPRRRSLREPVALHQQTKRAPAAPRAAARESSIHIRPLAVPAPEARTARGDVTPPAADD